MSQLALKKTSRFAAEKINGIVGDNEQKIHAIGLAALLIRTIVHIRCQKRIG